MSTYTEIAEILARIEHKDYRPKEAPTWYWERNWLSDEEYLAMGPEAVKESKWYNDGTYNVRRHEHPGDGWVEGRTKHQRKPATEETRDKISHSLHGNVPYNKGVKGVSEETSEKMSKSAKKRATSNSMKRVRSFGK